MATPEIKFKVNDEVLSYHGPLMYIAKILEVDPQATNCYFVHYQGWNKKWDEWVDPTRVIEKNEEGLRLQAELFAKLQAARNKKSKKEKEEDPSKDKKKGRKRKAEDESVDTDENRVSQKEIKITIPGPLKKRLVTDWELINRRAKLVPLPRNPTVAGILTEFLESKKNRKPESQKVVKELVEGLKLYFDRALPNMLLYRYERPQLEEIMSKKGGTPFVPSEIYGGEHLLRLLVKLPSLFFHTTMHEFQVVILQKLLADFIKFLQRSTHFFTEDYKEPEDPEYKHKVQQPEAANASAMETS